MGAAELAGEISPGPGASEPKYFAIHDFVCAELAKTLEAAYGSWGMATKSAISKYLADIGSKGGKVTGIKVYNPTPLF